MTKDTECKSFMRFKGLLFKCELKKDHKGNHKDTTEWLTDEI